MIGKAGNPPELRNGLKGSTKLKLHSSGSYAKDLMQSVLAIPQDFLKKSTYKTTAEATWWMFERNFSGRTDELSPSTKLLGPHQGYLPCNHYSAQSHQKGWLHHVTHPREAKEKALAKHSKES